MKTLMLIFLGGGCGSVLRYMVSQALPGLASQSHFPLGTLVCNVCGCLLIGLFNGLAGRWGMGPDTKLLLTVGLCGGFTTFSTMSNESLQLISMGCWGSYALYLGLSVILGLLAVWAGISIAS